MKLKEYVEEEEVIEANRLMSVATLRAATDKKTGRIDMGAITTGLTISDQNKLNELMNDINAYFENSSVNKISFNNLYTNILNNMQQDIDQYGTIDNDTSNNNVPNRSEFREVIERLVKEGTIRMDRTDTIFIN